MPAPITPKEHDWSYDFVRLINDQPEKIKLVIEMWDQGDIKKGDIYAICVSKDGFIDIERDWVNQINKMISSRPKRLWLSADEDGWFIGKGKPKCYDTSYFNGVCFETDGVDFSERKRFYFLEVSLCDDYADSEYRESLISGNGTSSRPYPYMAINTKCKNLLYSFNINERRPGS